MKHPFDDFLPPSVHAEREDRRVIRIGVVLVAFISITTVIAFSTTVHGWRNLLLDREAVSVRWNDANTRVHAYVKAQKNVKNLIDSAINLERFVDSVPRSLILWELTQILPAQSSLDDIRLETRERMVDGVEKYIERITLIGVSNNDSSISTYIDGLSNSPYFANVSLLYSQQDGETSRRKFSMLLEIGSEATFVLENK